MPSLLLGERIRGGSAILDEPVLDPWDFPDHDVRDDRGRPARSFANNVDKTAKAAPVDAQQVTNFPTSVMRKVAAAELNKETFDELSYEFGATPLQLARVRQFQPDDPIVDEAIASLTITGLNQVIEVTNAVMDSFREIMHRHIPSALYAARINATFKLENTHCSRTEVAGRAERIIRAAGGHYLKRWDENYD